MANHLVVIWLSVLVLVSVGVTRGQVVTSVVTTTNTGGTITITTTTTTNTTNTAVEVSGSVTQQDVVNAVTTAYEKANNEATAKYNAEAAVAKNVLSLIKDTGLEVGTRLTNEYFLEGVVAIQGTGEFLKGTNPFLVDINENNVKQMPKQANLYYNSCISKNVDAASLTKIVTNVPQEAVKISTADAAFKIALARCVSVNLDQVVSCAVNALKANPLSQVSVSLVNGLSLAKAHVKCLEEAVNKTRINGNITIKSITRVYPENAKFLLPEQFDTMADRVLAQASSIVIPTDKLNLAKTLQQARNSLFEAWAAKGTTLALAKSSLDSVFGNFNNQLGNVNVSPEAAFCLVNAKASTLANLNLQASGLFQCILNIQAPASPQALLNLEASLVERETKESISSSTIQCYKDIKNAFYPNELLCCLTESQDDYRVFLDDVTISGKSVLRKASEINDLFKQCKLSAVQSAQKKFDDDFSTFDKCLKTNTKVTITFP